MKVTAKRATVTVDVLLEEDPRSFSLDDQGNVIRWKPDHHYRPSEMAVKDGILTVSRPCSELQGNVVSVSTETTNDPYGRAWTKSTYILRGVTAEGAYNSLTCDQEGIRVVLPPDSRVESSLTTRQMALAEYDRIRAVAAQTPSPEWATCWDDKFQQWAEENLRRAAERVLAEAMEFGPRPRPLKVCLADLCAAH